MTDPLPRPSDLQALDAALTRLSEGARRFARMPLRERASLARAMLAGTQRTASSAVLAACTAKRIPFDSPQAGEEWLSGPYVTARVLRQLARSLLALEKTGNTPGGTLKETVDGRLAMRVFPANLEDALIFKGVRAEVHFQAGVDRAAAERDRARFYKSPDHDGRVCLVLGAGNINSIPATDVAMKLFNEGKVCLLKLNPVNAYLGPILEEAFADAISLGALAIVQGGATEGEYLARHPTVGEVHITGSDKTHDTLVWGPPGPAREERKAAGRPLLQKEVTSELGNISPVLLVPGPWDKASLLAQAESVAGAVTHNASCNCNAAKLLVSPRGFAGREEFLSRLEECLAKAPPRAPFYPGSLDRYRALTEGRPETKKLGGGEGVLPWTLVYGLDPEANDPAFTTEPFCPVLSETSLGSSDPVEYLSLAVDFVNQKVWGTLAAHILVHPRTLADPRLSRAVEDAIRKLRYGTVAVNVWAGYGFAFGTTPWGAFPGSTLADVQSGRGFVHNTLMLEAIEKAVIRHPVRTFPKPPYFPSHRTAQVLGRRLVDLESGRLSAIPGVVSAGVGG